MAKAKKAVKAKVKAKAKAKKKVALKAKAPRKAAAKKAAPKKAAPKKPAPKKSATPAAPVASVPRGPSLIALDALLNAIANAESHIARFEDVAPDLEFDKSELETRLRAQGGFDTLES